MGTGGPSALETPTAFRLNGKRLVGFERKTKIKFGVSIDLFSRPVARQVFSALQSLTSVFGMGTGGPSALETLTIGYVFSVTCWCTFRDSNPGPTD